MKEFSHDPHFAATPMLRTVGALVEGVSVLKIPPFSFPRKGFGDGGNVLPGSYGFYSDATSLAPSIPLTTITCSWASFYMEPPPPRKPKIQAGGLICLWPLPSSSCFRVGPWTLAQVESNCYFRSPIALPLFHRCLIWFSLPCNTCPPFFFLYIIFLFTNNSTT